MSLRGTDHLSYDDGYKDGMGFAMLQAEQKIKRLEELYKSALEIGEQRRLDVERLRADIKFLGAFYNAAGDLEIDMPKYHKAHCDKCGSREQCECRLHVEIIAEQKEEIRRLKEDKQDAK